VLPHPFFNLVRKGVFTPDQVIFIYHVYTGQNLFLTLKHGTMKNIDESLHFGEDPQEQLRIENELMRIRLQAEKGAEVHISAGASLEMEHAFLKMVMAIEGMIHSEKITIHRFIGEPPLPDLTETRTDNECSKQIDILLKKLIDNGIEIIFRGELSGKEMLRFLVEDLMFSEIEDIRLPNVRSLFFYESYYPLVCNN
jgi:hypothetical protein